MKSWANIRRGAEARYQGQLFEDAFVRACVHNEIACTRMPDGCKQVGPKRLIRVKTPWDWIISLNTRTALLDTKSTNDKAFAHTHIQIHQVRPMVDHACEGVTAGYVIWYRQHDRVVFISAHSLMKRLGSRGSIPYNDPDCRPLGSISSLDIPKLFDGQSLYAQTRQESHGRTNGSQ